MGPGKMKVRRLPLLPLKGTAGLSEHGSTSGCRAGKVGESTRAGNGG